MIRNDKELKALQANFFILNRPLGELETVSHSHFKKAGIAVIVAARMKSSRLPQKAILPIHGMSSIQRCLDNCLKFPHVDEVILAINPKHIDFCGALLKKYRIKKVAHLVAGGETRQESVYNGLSAAGSFFPLLTVLPPVTLFACMQPLARMTGCEMAAKTRKVSVKSKVWLEDRQGRIIFGLGPDFGRSVKLHVNFCISS